MTRVWLQKCNRMPLLFIYNTGARQADTGEIVELHNCAALLSQQ